MALSMEGTWSTASTASYARSSSGSATVRSTTDLAGAFPGAGTAPLLPRFADCAKFSASFGTCKPLPTFWVSTSWATGLSPLSGEGSHCHFYMLRSRTRVYKFFIPTRCTNTLHCNNNPTSRCPANCTCHTTFIHNCHTRDPDHMAYQPYPPVLIYETLSRSCTSRIRQ